jgi:antitoxin Phd
MTKAESVARRNSANVYRATPRSQVTDSARLVAVHTIIIYDHHGHMQGVMRKVQLKDAKANLSAVVEQATRGKPSVITRHGKPQAVVLGFADWQRLSRVPSFGWLLMSAPLESGDLPKRSRAPMRDAGL